MQRPEHWSICSFINLTKAFDTVSHDGLWKILACLGCPPKFLTISCQLHEGQQGQVKHNGSLSGSFPLYRGVRQGCVFAPKIQVYRAVVIPILLYDAETWVLYQKQVRLLEQFHQCCLHSVLGIKWPDHMSNEEVLKRASLPNIESILLQVQLFWAGHVTRMEDVHMPKAVFFSELQEGKHNRGAPRKCYTDQLKRQLAQAGLSHQ